MSLDDPEDLLGAIDRAIRPVRRPNPLLVVYRWRYEIALVVAAYFAAPAIAGLTTPIKVGLTALLLLPLAVPPVRRFVWRRLRAIVLQHRLRTAFVRARVHSNAGRIPALIWTSPRSHADRVLLFLPAGLTGRLLATEADRIAVACDGTHAEVLPFRAHRVLVWLVVVRA